MRHFPLRSAIAILFLCAAALAQNPTASVTVDAGAGRHSIDPGIYGIAYGTTQQLTDLNVPLNRYGGNNASRYNWQLNADNRGQDWYFESIPDASSLAGERGDTFVSTTQSGGARPMITIPMLDWVGKLGANRSKLASFSQAKYGAQTGNRILDYAAQIRAADPNAKIVGPEEWGWSGYFYSGYDQQYGSQNGWSFLPDRANHGGADYLPWLLNQIKLDGRHLLDIFTVHYYPQGGEFSNDTSTTMQLLRNRSTRSLWDPNYTDPTWINDKVMLIPRLRNWVNTYYEPGTPTGITEYNWGAESHINGATTQADILGIFGRESLDLAARWTTPDSTTPTYKAIKMYRNYDGNRSTFGDVSVSAAVLNPDNVAAFAARRTSDGALTVMVISKYLSGTTPVSIGISNFSGSGTARVYQLTAANLINRLSDLSFTSTVNLTLPPQSITLFVIPTGTPNTPPVAMAAGSPLSGIVPLTVNFSSAGSYDPDGSVAGYSWNFGDGSPSSTAAAPSHVYSNAGNFTAVLTVTDNRGATSTAQVTVTASPDPNFINAPSNLTGSAGKSSAKLTWNDNSANEAGFYIERAPSGSASFVRIGSVPANTSTFSDSVGRGNYTYRIQAFNSTALSAYSNSVTVRVK